MIRTTKAIFFPILIASLVTWVPRGAADTTPEQRRLRFNQILEVMKDNGDRVIDEGELEAFLRDKATVIVARLSEAGFVVTAQNKEALDKFLHRQAVFIINGPAGGGKGITEARLERFEEAELQYPFVGTIKDLLPPPPSALVSADTPADRARTLPTSILDQVGEWLSVRRSFLRAKDIARPATFSVTHFGANDDTREAGRPRTVFDVAGAVALKIHEFNPVVGSYTLQWSPVAVFEADISTDAKVGRDKIIYRLGADGVLYETIPTPGWTGHNFTATFDYTTDRNYHSSVVGGTAQYSPNILPIGIGHSLRVGTLPLWFRWRPYVGLTGGAVLDDGGKKALQGIDSFVNMYVRAGADVLFGSRLHLTPEVTWFQELQHRKKSHGLFTVGLRYSIDDKDRLSVEVGYSRGEDSPEFVDQDQLTFGLGIKF